MKATIKKFGLYTSVTSAVLFFSALYFLKDFSYGTQEIIGYATIITSLLFIFFGIKYFRDKENNGVVTFKKAFLIGILISLFAATAFAIIDFIYTTVIDQTFVNDYIQKTESSMSVMGMATTFAFLMFATVFIIGFIISLLSALILQQKD